MPSESIFSTDDPPETGPETPSAPPPSEHRINPLVWVIGVLALLIVLALVYGYFSKKSAVEKAKADAIAAEQLKVEHEKQLVQAKESGYHSAIADLESFTPQKHPFLTKQEAELLAMRQTDGTRAVIVVGENEKAKQYIAGLAFQTGINPPKTLVYCFDPEVGEYRYASTLAIPYRHPAEIDVFYGDVLDAIKQFRLERLPAKGGSK